MRKRILAAVLALFVLLYSFVGVRAVSAAAGSVPVAVMSAPTVIDESLTPGSIFSINITIANIEKLWGYEFLLFYNTSVIDAIDYAFTDPRFTLALPSEIGANYTILSRGTYNGDREGVTIADPIPVARIDFVVTGYGATSLHFDLELTQLANIYGNAYDFFTGNFMPVDGRFLNIQMPLTHDVAITRVYTSKTTALEGDLVTVTVDVTNQGDFAENVIVSVIVDRSNIGTATIVNQQPGNTTYLNFTWNTYGFLPWWYWDGGPSARNFTVVAQAGIVPGEIDTADNLFFDGVVTLFKWEFTFHDEARGTTLRINTRLKIFHFTTPENDYTTKRDPNMNILGSKVKIDYEDPEISLRSVSSRGPLVLCTAVAFDKNTQTKYLLHQTIKL